MTIPFYLFPAWITLCIAILVSSYWFKWINNIYRLLTIFLWATAVANFASINIKNNLILLPALSLATLLIFTTIYLKEFLQKRPISLLVVTVIALVVVIIDMYNSYHNLSIQHFYALGTVATDSCIIIFCLYYFWVSLQEEAPLNKELWILNSGFLIYFSIHTLLFFSINFLINESLKVVLPFWILNAFSASFLYSFLIYRIWRHGKMQKQRLHLNI